MGIRYEKDTFLNWINEMGKFLRLIVGKWENGLEDLKAEDIEQGYRDFFQKEKAYFEQNDMQSIQKYIEDTLQDEQIRPLALLLMYDGLCSKDHDLLKKAKGLLEYHAQKTGNFSFEDFDHLDKINRVLASS